MHELVQDFFPVFKSNCLGPAVQTRKIHGLSKGRRRKSEHLFEALVFLLIVFFCHYLYNSLFSSILCLNSHLQHLVGSPFFFHHFLIFVSHFFQCDHLFNINCSSINFIGKVGWVVHCRPNGSRFLQVLGDHRGL